MDILREAAARKAQSAKKYSDDIHARWKTQSKHSSKDSALGCISRKPSVKKRRKDFWRSQIVAAQLVKATDVPFEAIMWLADQKSDRVTSQNLNLSPEDICSPVQRKLFDDVNKLLESESAMQATEQVLRTGIAPACWYAWLALEKFRTSYYYVEDDVCSTNDGRDVEARKEAMVLAQLFCDQGSPFFVPVGTEIRETIHRVLHSTPEHVDIGRKLFLGMQGKIMVEMERFLMEDFLSWPRLQQTAQAEGAVVLGHMSLAEILSSPTAQKTFASYLAGKDPLSHSLLVWLSGQSSSSRAAALSESQVLRTELARIASQELVSAAAKNERENSLRKLENHIFFYLRDRHMTDFMWTEQYLQCVSQLTGIAYPLLSEASLKSGEAILEATATECKQDERFEVSEQAVSESALDGSSVLSAHSKAGRPSVVRRLTGSIRRNASKGARKIGLALPPQTQELRLKVKISATPREWRYAQRCCCETTPRKMEACVSSSVAVTGPTQYVVLGLEGVMQHPRLRLVFKAYLCETFRPTDQYAMELLRALKALRTSTSMTPDVVVQHTLPILKQYVDDDFLFTASTDELNRVCTNIFARKYMPLISALAQVPQAF